MQAGRILTGKNAGPRGRANGASSISVAEPDTFTRKTIQVWRVHDSIAVWPCVMPSQIIDKHEHKVPGLWCCRLEVRSGSTPGESLEEGASAGKKCGHELWLASLLFLRFRLYR